MPSLAAVTLQDSTPDDIVYTPTDVKEGNASWHARESGVAIGFPKLLVALRTPAPAKPGQGSVSSRVYRVPFKLTVPTLEVIGNAQGNVPAPPTKAYDLVFNGEFVLSERSTLTQRKDFIAQVKSLLGSSMMLSVVENLEAIY